MKRIIISPYSKGMREAGKVNPKNYPYWKELVRLLKSVGYEVTQVGVVGEEKVDGVDGFATNLSLEGLELMLKGCFAWISVDNFFQHFAWYHEKKGIAIFGQSDPLIFGHNTNVNVLKDRKYLRQNQFDIWERAAFIEDAFVRPEVVVGFLSDF